MTGGGASVSATSPGGAANDGAAFEAFIEPISEVLAQEMVGVSWHPGCPVPISELRLITMDHWGFDGQLHRGELVVHEDVAEGVVGVFGQLFAARFPIMRMERIERYDGDDERSMAADNTSSFNCREIAGGGPYSVHSWGKAIDINPLENPYIKDGRILPPAGAAFLDRDDVRQGMIVDGHIVVEAFAAIGFTWGGDWERLKDYQHFEAPDPQSRSSDRDRNCPTYAENPGSYPVELCQRGLAVENVQAQLARRGYDVEVDGHFSPATEAAVRQFQGDEALEVDGLVGPVTWPALIAGSVVGSDEDGNGSVEPWEIPVPPQRPGCSVAPPPSGARPARAPAIDPSTGALDTAPFNEFLAAADPPVSTSPCDAARVLLGLDRAREAGESVVIVVGPERLAQIAVAVTLDHLLDDSVAAVRYRLHFERRQDGTLELAAGTWSQRCQQGRGHQEFSTDLCV